MELLGEVGKNTEGGCDGAKAWGHRVMWGCRETKKLVAYGWALIRGAT